MIAHKHIFLSFCCSYNVWAQLATADVTSVVILLSVNEKLNSSCSGHWTNKYIYVYIYIHVCISVCVWQRPQSSMFYPTLGYFIISYNSLDTPTAISTERSDLDFLLTAYETPIRQLQLKFDCNWVIKNGQNDVIIMCNRTYATEAFVLMVSALVVTDLWLSWASKKNEPRNGFRIQTTPYPCHQCTLPTRCHP